MNISDQNMEIEQNFFIIYIKTEDFFEDISSDVEKWYDTSNRQE